MICKFYRKDINIRKKRVYTKGEEGQMLLTGAIIAAAVIVTLSVVIMEVANLPTTVPLEQGFVIYPAYGDIREKFGFALDDLIELNPSNLTWIYSAFNRTKNAFSMIEARHMQYFDAELIDVNLYENEVDLKVELSLKNDRCIINEEVLYIIK